MADRHGARNCRAVVGLSVLAGASVLFDEIKTNRPGAKRAIGWLGANGLGASRFISCSG